MSKPPFLLTILGSGSAIPMPGRNPAGQVVRYGSLTILIDCGEATQIRLRECGIKPFRIDLILVSHLHGDHVFGLPGLISSMNHLGREAPLTVVGPPGLAGFLDTIYQYCAVDIGFPLTIKEIRPASPVPVWDSADLAIQAFPLDHRIETNGYLIRERKSGVRFIREALDAQGLKPDAIRALADRVAEGVDPGDPDTGILFEPVDPVSYAYCSDTRYDPRIAAWVKGVSVLYHETTFLDELTELARETGHTTAAQAGRLAAEAGAGWLVTGHYSSRYKDNEIFAREAGLYFPRVIAGQDSGQYNLRELADSARAG